MTLDSLWALPLRLTLVLLRALTLGLSLSLLWRTLSLRLTLPLRLTLALLRRLGLGRALILWTHILIGTRGRSGRSHLGGTCTEMTATAIVGVSPGAIQHEVGAVGIDTVDPELPAVVAPS